MSKQDESRAGVESLAAYAPEVFEKYYESQNVIFGDGALDMKTKWLVGFAVAISHQCPYCIEAYTQDCLNLGYTKEQLTEAMMVASAARGGAVFSHGEIMAKVFEENE